MKIELLLNRVSFEHSIKSGQLAFNGWFHGPASGDKNIKGLVPLIDLRKESWGGLFVYGMTAQIFTVDEDAFSLLERIKNGETLDDLSQSPSPLTHDDFISFQEQLTNYEIEL
ncbi:hypothetical protein [Flavobacterium sp. FlaQc-48]|uniref:hypothetical protein n=1 Tax=Flavobacterium sp. FlaQc-48 TaxID=3374181 RepID=UPI0037584BCB